jgi:DNA repair exonuclease SbcCD ATPase subunit
MRLLRLELRNWCQFDQFACDFHPGMTAIIGQNGSGKSNILGAISWLLTGENPNKGVKELNIRQAAPDTAAANGTLTFEHMGQVCSVTRHLRPTRSRATFTVNSVQTALGDQAVTTAVAEALQLNTKVITRFVIVAQADIYGFLESTDSQVDQFFQRLFDTATATECVKAIGSATAKIQIPQIADNETTAAVGATIIHCEEQIRQLQTTLQQGGLADPSADQQDYAIINAGGDRELLSQQFTQAHATLSATANDLANKEAELLQLQRDRDTLQQAVNDKTPNADKARAALQSWATYESLVQQRDQVEQAITQAEQDAAGRVQPTRPQDFVADLELARNQLTGLQHQIGSLRHNTQGYSPERLAHCEQELQKPAPTPPEDYADGPTQQQLIRDRANAENQISRDQVFVQSFKTGQDCQCPTCRTAPPREALAVAVAAAEQAIATNQQLVATASRRVQEARAYEARKGDYDKWRSAAEHALSTLRQQQLDAETLSQKESQAATLSARIDVTAKYLTDSQAYDTWNTQFQPYIQGLYTQRQQLARMPVQAAVDQASLQAVVVDLDEYRKGLEGLTPAIDSLQGQINRLRTNHGVQAGRLQEIEGQISRLPSETALQQAQQRVQARQQAAATRMQATLDLQTAQSTLMQARQQWPLSQAKEREAAALGAWLLRLEQIRALLTAAPRFVAQHNLQLLKHDMDATLDIFDSRFHVTADEGLRFTAGFQDGKTQPADRLSGGQKVALALGFRVAVNSMFATRVGLLALDEPTAYLDKQRVRALAPVISRLRELTASRGLQCLIVTHEEELAPLFDATIRVGVPTVTG